MSHFSTNIQHDPLLTRREVAGLLKVHSETVKRMERRGELTAIHINSRVVRYRYSEVMRLLAAATIPAKNLTLNSPTLQPQTAQKVRVAAAK